MVRKIYVATKDDYFPSVVPSGSVTVDLAFSCWLPKRESLVRNLKAFWPYYIDKKNPAPYKAPDGTEYSCFGNWYRSRKVFAEVDHAVTERWFRKQSKPKWSHPRAKDKDILYAIDSRFPGERLGRVEARKKIKVPDYINKLENDICSKIVLEDLRVKSREDGPPIVIVDFSGPRGDESVPLCLEVTKEMLREKINDESRRFGYGYILAACISGIAAEEYTS